MAIDIGAAATDRASFLQTSIYTVVGVENPANATGTMESVEVWYDTASTNDVWVGTFSAVGNVLTVRDSESIGNVASGSKQTVSGLDIDVTAGDYLGTFSKISIAQIERDNSGSGYWFYLGEVIDATDSQTFTLGADRTISLFGTGTAAAAGWAGGDFNGVPLATIKKINGVAIGDIKKVNGI